MPAHSFNDYDKAVTENSRLRRAYEDLQLKTEGVFEDNAIKDMQLFEAHQQIEQLQSQLHQCREALEKISDYTASNVARSIKTKQDAWDRLDAIRDMASKDIFPSQPSRYQLMEAVVEAAREFESDCSQYEKPDSMLWMKLRQTLAALDSEGVE